MRLYLVTIGPKRGQARLSFEAIAADSCSAFDQHVCLALPDERVEIVLLAGAAIAKAAPPQEVEPG